MRVLSPSLHAARMMLSQAQGWLTFVQIQRFAGGYFRLVEDTRHRQGNGVKWQACGMRVEIPEENADGSLVEATIGIPNVSRIPLALVETQDEIIGAEITIWMQHEGSLETFTDALSWRLKGLRVDADAEVMAISVGHPAAGLLVPRLRFGRRNFPQVSARGGISL